MFRFIGRTAAAAACALMLQAAWAQAPAAQNSTGGSGGQAPSGQAQSGPGMGGQAANLPPGIVRTDVTTVRSPAFQYSVLAAQAAIDACVATDPHVAVVVVDTGGNPRTIMVADGAKSSLVENARRKAYTAAGVRQVTSVEQKLIQANPTMIIPPQSAYLMEPGGVPIRAGTQVIGGIGVEGGDPMEAEKCAQVGVDKLKDQLHPEIPGPNAARPSVPTAQ